VADYDRTVRRYEGLLSRALSGRRSAESDVAEKLRTLEALDIAISLADERVRPDAAGCVVPSTSTGAGAACRGL